MKEQAGFKDSYEETDDNTARMKTENKFHDIVIKNIKNAIAKLEKEKEKEEK